MVGHDRRYKVLETIGKGGFGVVYRAALLGSGGFSKQVALKVLTVVDGEDAEEMALRLRDEARMLGLIDHRAVVGVDSLARLETGWAVVMEYVPGVNVSALVKQNTPVKVALEVAEEVASALHAAYAMPSSLTGEPLKLVHRDIKPSNIRVTPQGTVKVLDFGVARAEFGNREAVTTKYRFGSLRYMAPERFDGVETHAGDIFALGLMLGELCSGRRFPEPPKSEKRYADFYKAVLATSRQGMIERQGIPIPMVDRIVMLLADLLDYEMEGRPAAKLVQRRCRELMVEIDGPWLRDWAETEIPRIAESQPKQDGPTNTILQETGDLEVRSFDTSTRKLLAFDTQAQWRKAVVALIVIGGLLLLLGVGGIAGLVWVFDGPLLAAAPDADPAPVVATEPDPEPEPRPEPEPEPEPEPPEPVEVEPVEPEPMAAPDPKPKPKPKPKARPRASVQAVGDAVRVELRGKGGKHVLSGTASVPPGTYQVYATFFEDSGAVESGTVEVASGATVTVRCTSMLMRCSVK